MRGLFFLCFAVVCTAADPTTVLRQKCFGCHDTAHIRKSVVPGDPDSSKLLKMISGDPPKMPLGRAPLSKEQVAEIRAWIESGAKWPEDEWWSLKPLRKPAAGNSIDEFLSAKLREQGLRPMAEADRVTLIRRLTYDLHGLPPSWDEVRAFLSDRSPDAYEKLVDRLLASPRFGERWARHWLDVVHYGESHGYDKDKPRRNAWPYRDYVIRAFNEDKPYARFVQEQLAGDVLWPADPQSLVATGFIAAGPWDFVGHVELREGTTDKAITRVLDRDDMVMTTISTFTSMTAHCARCHDHKFDPIKQEDYYSLQAVFAGVDRAERPYDSDPKVFAARRALWERRRGISSRMRPLEDAIAHTTSPALEKLDAELSEIKFDFAQTKKAELQPQIAKLTAERKALLDSIVDPAVKRQLEALQKDVRALDDEIKGLPKPQWVYAGANYFDPQSAFRFAVEPRPIAVLARGSVESPGKAVGPGALSCVGALAARFDLPRDANEGARRAALAKWITAPENMLTWRSIVNRVWQYHFGAGIVDSASDFGRMGAQPTHPELLDWLAVTFRDGGGSLKRLHKQIVMSAAYRRASGFDEQNAAKDAENRYLWRMNRRRLEAEAVRDGILQASGKLDLTMGGPSVEQFWFKDDHSPIYDYAKFDVDSPASYRRSIYRFIVRSVSDPFMDRLDCPDASLIAPKRNTTITAIQALALLNNPFVIRQSEHLAERLRAISADPRTQIEWLYRLALSRDARPAESARLVEYAAKHGLENACRTVLNSNEFLFVD